MFPWLWFSLMGQPDISRSRFCVPDNPGSSNLALRFREEKMTQKTLICVVAHPDDETFGAGGTLIHAASEGAKVITICATRGEAGEIMDRSNATPETLAAVRESEYRRAGQIMGVSESILLGYRDSGMAGTPENEDPRAFIQQPEDQVVADIIEVMDRVKPDVMLAMEPGGGYGHPDHKFATKCALAAFEQARTAEHQRGWAPQKFYYFGFPRSRMREAFERIATEDPDSDMAQVDVETLGVPDEEITLTVDIPQHEDQLREAFAAHLSQLSPLDRMPDDIARTFLHYEHYIRAYPPPSPDEQETGIFDGI